MRGILLTAALTATLLLGAQAPPGDPGRGVQIVTDPVTADNEPLDLKGYSCSQHLEILETEDGRSDIVTVWAHGYYNGMRQVDETSDPDEWVTVERFSQDIVRACEANPEKLFIRAVKDLAGSKP